MERSSGADKKDGHYLGTEIDEKWWKRYTGNKLLARGNGEYWMEQDAFCFHRFFTKSDIRIRFKDIVDVKIGKWHSGRWHSGWPIVKIVWMKDGVRLSSGFGIVESQNIALSVVDDLKERAGIKKQDVDVRAIEK